MPCVIVNYASALSSPSSCPSSPRTITAHLCARALPPPHARDITFIASSPRFFLTNNHFAHPSVASSTSPVPRQYSYTSRTSSSSFCSSCSPLLLSSASSSSSISSSTLVLVRAENTL